THNYPPLSYLPRLHLSPLRAALQFRSTPHSGSHRRPPPAYLLPAPRLFSFPVSSRVRPLALISPSSPPNLPPS
ncbi:hypothetical protein JTE90_020644, partial [Oedothorax gibbosus]